MGNRTGIGIRAFAAMIAALVGAEAARDTVKKRMEKARIEGRSHHFTIRTKGAFRLPGILWKLKKKAWKFLIVHPPVPVEKRQEKGKKGARKRRRIRRMLRRAA